MCVYMYLFTFNSIFCLWEQHSNSVLAFIGRVFFLFPLFPSFVWTPVLIGKTSSSSGDSSCACKGRTGPQWLWRANPEKKRKKKLTETVNCFFFSIIHIPIQFNITHLKLIFDVCVVLWSVTHCILLIHPFSGSDLNF